MDQKKLISEFEKIVQKENVFLDEATRTQKGQDATPIRVFQSLLDWKPLMPAVVLKPATAQEISKILKLCNDNKVPVIGYGGGSGVLKGVESLTEDTVVIDVSRLNKIEKPNDEDLTITCGAGVWLKDLEAFVNKKGYITGHYPQSFDLAQMGGLVATNSIGQFSTRYGGIEDLLVAIQAVLPNGEIIDIKPNPRRAVGPDLRHLFLGSEGFLGIITQVTVKLFPKPESRWKCAYRVADMDVGLECIRLVMREGVHPAVVRLHDWLECEGPYGAFMEENESLLIFISEGPKAMTDYEGAVVDKVVKAAGGIPVGTKPVDIWDKHKNDIADEQDKYAKMGLVADTIEISAPWSKIHKIYADTVDRAYMEVQELIYFSGHSSHSYLTGTNIYFMFAAFPDGTIEGAAKLHNRIWQIVMEETLKNGGSIAHHHGIGKMRTPYMKEELGSAYILLEKVKNSIDPNNIMNPGAIIDKK